MSLAVSHLTQQASMLQLSMSGDIGGHVAACHEYPMYPFTNGVVVPCGSPPPSLSSGLTQESAILGTGFTHVGMCRSCPFVIAYSCGPFHSGTSSNGSGTNRPTSQKQPRIAKVIDLLTDRLCNIDSSWECHDELGDLLGLLMYIENACAGATYLVRFLHWKFCPDLKPVYRCLSLHSVPSALLPQSYMNLSG
jgi:hypothetical protein